MKRAAIAIDPGTKRTGFAVADALRISVQPLEVMQGPASEVPTYVKRLLDERDVAHIIVGYPLHMDGKKGARAKDVDGLIEGLRERFPAVKIVPCDERLSTKEAEDRLREAGHHGAERKKRRDSWSAAVILEDWIRAGEPDAD